MSNPDTQLTRAQSHRGRLDVGKALKLYLGGTKEVDIARLHGVTKQSVNQALKPFKEIIKDPAQINAFEASRDAMLSGGMMRLLTSALDPRTIKKSSTLQLASAYGILFDKQRLVRGESTENVSIKSITMHLKGELDRLRDQEQALASVNDINELGEDLT